MMKKYLFVTLFLVVILLPVRSLAQQEVTVGAVVDSHVSKIQSSITTNASEVLADPASHSILLTVKLKDANGMPLPNIPVIVTSNRGQVDVIEAVNKLSLSLVRALNANDMQKDKTDKDGKVEFRVTSFIAGEAILNVLADSLVNLDPIKVKFDPLPFPTDVTIAMTNPFNGKEISLYSPKKASKGLSGAQANAQKLVNTGTKVQFSFWLITIPIFLILLCPFFIILSFINLRKMRRMENEQCQLLKKMFPPNHNRHK